MSEQFEIGKKAKTEKSTFTVVRFKNYKRGSIEVFIKNDRSGKEDSFWLNIDNNGEYGVLIRENFAEIRPE